MLNLSFKQTQWRFVLRGGREGDGKCGQSKHGGAQQEGDAESDAISHPAGQRGSQDEPCQCPYPPANRAGEVTILFGERDNAQ